MANVAGFPEAWNCNRKYSYSSLLGLSILRLRNNPLYFAATDRPLQLVSNLADWVRRVLPCTVGIRDWPSFWKIQTGPSLNRYFHYSCRLALVVSYIVMLIFLCFL